MFQTISRFTDRYRTPLLIGWIAVAVLITILAPNFDDVATNDQSDFLPDDAPSIAGQQLVAEYFPEQIQKGNITIVFDAGDGEKITASENMGFIGDFSSWLVSDEGPEGIRSVQSPTLIPEAASAFISPDEQLAIVALSLSITDDVKIVALIDEIGERLDTAPNGVHSYQTGQSAIFADYNETITETVDRTLFVTLALVIVILLVIYRSPVSPFVPLSVVTIAYLIARGIVASLGDAGVFTVSGTAGMLLIVVMYGSGTDFCLFLINRFREEMSKRDDPHHAVRNTVRHVGESITSSAGTTTTGFLAMATAQLGLFNNTGPTLAIGIVVGLLAGLTLTPSMLGLLGQRTFWPGKATKRETSTFYKRTSQMVSSRPLLTIGIIVLVMAPFAIYGTGQTASYDTLTDLPDDLASVKGFRLLEEHIGAGNLQPLTVVTELDGDDLLGKIETLTADLQAVDGVSVVRSASQPLGSEHTPTVGATRIDHQLAALSTVTTPSDEAAEPTPEQTAMMDSLLADLPNYLTLIAEHVPEIAETSVYADTMAMVNVSNETGELSPELSGSLFALSEAVPNNLHIPFTELPAGIYTVLGGDNLAGLMASFLNIEGSAARFEIVLSNSPYGVDAMDTVVDIRDTLKNVSGDDAVVGSTAIQADIRDLLAEDMRLTILLVLVGIFIVLTLMLRSLVAPAYLIGTILLSYGTTLGITRLASGVFWGNDEITWWVPFFVFVFLVALGIDYSIFLFGRIKEEVNQHGIQDGIHSAVEATGSIITSAGIIVAGTFGALMTGEILGLAQIGFAVSVGILIDTFVVRTILDPALATFFGRWTWWPGRIEIKPQSDDDSISTSPMPKSSPPLSSGAD
jgi:RND superfamily putative drug exporter